MLRLTALRRALVSPAPICASAATSAQWVNRILGATNPGATNAKAFGEILTKVPSGKAAVYAHIGRALVFLNRGDDKLAKFDIDNAVKAAGTSGEAALLIASIQYQVAARNLAEEQRKATISGATTEADIMKATEQAKAALDAVVKLAGQDFAASLATAEFSLHSLGDAAASLAHFDAALQLANLHRTSSSSGPGKAEPWAVAAADVEETMSEVTFKSKNISAAKLVADPESLASLRDTLSASSLSDEEVTLLGSVFALSARGGTVFDAVRCNSEDFSPAPFRHAQSVVRRVAQLTHPLIEEHHFHPHKPSKAFFKEGVSIAGLVKDCPKDVHILDFVEQKAGKVPQTALSAQDKDFFTELDRIAHATADHVPTAPAAAQSFYNSLGTDLMEQVIFRAKVGRAEALLALKKAAEADALVTEVIQSQRYVDHWRALLVKGRTARALGKVDEAEAAFSELHGLKRQVGHNDIPLMDNNRYKSAF